MNKKWILDAVEATENQITSQEFLSMSHVDKQRLMDLYEWLVGL